MLSSIARRGARRGPDGRYIPLSKQDTKQWSLPLIEEAERHLAEAFRQGRSGRFNLKRRFNPYMRSSRMLSESSFSKNAVNFFLPLVEITPPYSSPL